MGLFEFISAHPVWTFVYLVVIGCTICTALGR